MTTTAACTRCGIIRAVKPERQSTGLCLDCLVVERDMARLGCGTWRGYYEHWKLGELACQACLDARAARQAELRRAKGIGLKPVAVCGTDSGYFAHRRLGETACRECLDAHNAASRRNDKRPRTGRAQTAMCGTYSGYHAHRRRDETPCDTCRKAKREYQREHRERNSTA